MKVVHSPTGSASKLYFFLFLPCDPPNQKASQKAKETKGVARWTPGGIESDFLQFQKLLTEMIHCCQEFLQPVRRPPRQTAVESKTDECSNESCSSIATFTTISQSECLLFAQLVFGDDVPFLNYSDSV